MWRRLLLILALIGVCGMTKYSTFKYGSTKYGALTTAPLLWTILVAWDGTYLEAPFDTPTLDNFNRADGPLGANWTDIPFGGSTYSPRIDTNRVAAEVASDIGIAYWNPLTPGDTAVYAKVTVRPDDTGYVMLLARFDPATFSGYAAVLVRDDTGGDFVGVVPFVNGSLQAAFAVGYQEFADGDSFGLRIVGTVFTIWYKSGAGSWVQIGSTAYDSTFTAAGRIGFMIGATTRLDDFGGGTYSNPNEATRATGLTVSRGRDNLIKPGGNGFEHMQVGEAVVTLDNEDGRYDPWNTSSPLYPNVTPGKFAKIQVKDISTGITYDIFRGVVDDIQPIGANRARLVIKDGIRWLRDRKINLGWATFKTGPLVGGILTNAQWPLTHWAFLPAGWSTLGILLNNWWGRNQTAIDAINDAEDKEFGVFFQDAAGQAKFYDRDYDYGAATVITEEEILTDIAFPQPWEVLRNRAKVYVYPKKLDTVNTTLWQIQDVPYIAGNGGTFVVEATFRYSIWTVCGSSVGWDYAVWTNANGTGVDITASVSASWSAIGDRSILTLTNSNPLGGYITLLRGVGDAIYPPYVTSFTEEDAVSEARYGYRDFILDNFWVESSEEGKNYANYVMVKLANPLMYPTIKIENRSALQFGLDLQSLVNLQMASRDIDKNLKIGKITHTWLSENGQAVRTTFKLEPYLDPAEGFWNLGTSQLGTTTILGF